jgi:hypothetical protein
MYRYDHPTGRYGIKNEVYCNPTCITVVVSYHMYTKIIYEPKIEIELGKLKDVAYFSI